VALLSSSSSMRRRLDAEMVRRGLAGSRTEATRAISSGAVTVAGRATAKPASLVSEADPIELTAASPRFVSRGGDKLDAALDRFRVPVAGRRTLDAGASTGGFTDVLLRGGAAHVVAVDVGYGQLDWSLRQDERVTVLERTNARALRPGDLPFRPDLVVADLSFISLRLVIPALVGVSAEGADFVLLVKPQFEAGRERVGRGGVVSDPAVWADVLRSVAESCAEHRLAVRGVMPSPLRGPAGNVEFLLHARGPGGPPSPTTADPTIDAAVQEASARG
jgi:23S rRNA (cytidine1920-2'-O)/16S rRNA (cytidine1409-2'-O)-methyltransferase